MNAPSRTLFLLAVLCAAAPVVHAGPLIYTPVNPTFGGASDNGTYLLDTANAVNKHGAPATSSSLGATEGESPLQQFNSELEEAILTRLATSVTSSIIGANGTLQPGTITTGQFSVTVTQLGGGQLQVTTTDNTNGQTTTFEVGQ